MIAHGLDLPAGFELASVAIGPGDDRRACGQRAARQALAALGEDPDALAYEGTRPIVDGRPGRRGRGANRGGRGEAELPVAVSIAHSRTIAVAVAGRAKRLGIDLCNADERLPRLAERFLASERAIASTISDLAACFAAKEAALKALGVGLVEGGVLDGTAVTVLALEPPTLSHEELRLVIAHLPEGALALAYTPA